MCQEDRFVWFEKRTNVNPFWLDSCVLGGAGSELCHLRPCIAKLMKM